MDKKLMQTAIKIVSQIEDGKPGLYTKIGTRSCSPMIETENRKGGLILHLPNDVKLSIELTWVDLYDVKLFKNVKSQLEEEEKLYTAQGVLAYELDGCYFDMLGLAIEEAMEELQNPQNPKSNKTLYDVYKNMPFSDN